MTAAVLEICTACDGRGQLPDSNLQRVECPLCEGYGVLFAECVQCKKQGFTEGADEYCDTCHGEGRISLARRVAETAEPRYVRYLVDLLRDYSQRHSQADLSKASELDAVLREVQETACNLVPKRDRELFPEQLCLSMNIARKALAQAMRLRSEQDQQERATLLNEARGTRGGQQDLRSESERLHNKYWQGWDTI